MKFRRLYLSICLLVVTTAGAMFVFGESTGASFEIQSPTASELPAIALTSPISGFNQPVTIAHAGDGSGRIFVVEQAGRIRIVKNGALIATPFLDICRAPA